MAVLEIALAIHDLKVPRAEPCSALLLVAGPEIRCGATPGAKYLRQCGIVSHSRLIWLCPVHAALAVMGGATCRECARRGGSSPVVLHRLTEPLRIAS
jgi:hypothetical protein